MTNNRKVQEYSDIEIFLKKFGKNAQSVLDSLEANAEKRKIAMLLAGVKPGTIEKLDKAGGLAIDIADFVKIAGQTPVFQEAQKKAKKKRKAKTAKKQSYVDKHYDTRDRNGDGVTTSSERRKGQRDERKDARGKSKDMRKSDEYKNASRADKKAMRKQDRADKKDMRTGQRAERKIAREQKTRDRKAARKKKWGL